MTVRARLGINTCFAVKRWPRPEDWGPIVVDRLGLRLVQHSFDLADPDVDDPARLRAVAADLGLELHSTFTGLAAYSSNLLLHPDPAARASAERWFGAAIDWTAAAGGRGTGGHVGAFSVPDWEDPRARDVRWRDLVAALDRLARRACEAGLDHIQVENLAAAREPSTMALIEGLLTSGDATRVPVRLALDVGHMCVPGTSGADRDPYAWLRQFGASAEVVQLQQSDEAGDHHWPFTERWNRTGRIDADRTIDALEAAGADTVNLILEVIPAFEQPDGDVLDDLEASVAYWMGALDRRGVAR